MKTSGQLVIFWIPWEMDPVVSINTDDLELLCQIVGIENNNVQPSNQTSEDVDSSTTAFEHPPPLPKVSEVKNLQVGLFCNYHYQHNNDQKFAFIA